jgi:hypothetical protein
VGRLNGGRDVVVLWQLMDKNWVAGGRCPNPSHGRSEDEYMLNELEDE